MALASETALRPRVAKLWSGGISGSLLDAAAFINGLALILAANLYFIRPIPILLQRADEAYAMAFAQRMIRGHDLPYVDAVSQKGPVFYWLVDAAVRLFGTESWLPMRILGISCMALTVSFCFAATCVAGRSLAGALMVLAYFALCLTGGGEGVAGFVMAFCSEHVANTFGMAALLAMTLASRKSRTGSAAIALVGVAGGLIMLASLSKQVAATLSVPFAIWALAMTVNREDPSKPRRWSFIFAFAAGMALPLAFVLVRYAIAGELHALLYYAITYNSTIFVPAVRGKHLVQFVSDLFELHAVLVILVTAFGAWILARHIMGTRRWHGLLDVATSRAFELTVGGAAIVTATIAVNARRTFPHYYVLPLPWFCLLGGLIIMRLVVPAPGQARRHPARTLIVHLAALAPLVVLANLGWALKQNTFSGEPGYQEAVITPAWDICKVVAEHTKPTDSIFVWGFDSIPYTACHRRPASRFLFNIFQTGYVPLLEDPEELEESRVSPGSQEGLLDDLRRDPPAAIFDASETLMGHKLTDYAFIRPLLAADYCPLDTLGRMAWIRKPPEGCPQSPSAGAPPVLKRPLRLYIGPRERAHRRDLGARSRHMDFVTLSKPDEIARALAQGYVLTPPAGWDFPGEVLATQQAGTVPLSLYYDPRTGDHLTIASPESRYEAEHSGYEAVGVEGYIYPDEQPDTVPLKLFYNEGTRDYLTTASGAEEGAARRDGYFMVRLEGYLLRT